MEAYNHEFWEGFIGAGLVLVLPVLARLGFRWWKARPPHGEVVLRGFSEYANRRAFRWRHERSGAEMVMTELTQDELRIALLAEDPLRRASYIVACSWQSIPATSADEVARMFTASELGELEAQVMDFSGWVGWAPETVGDSSPVQ